MGLFDWLWNLMGGEPNSPPKETSSAGESHGGIGKGPQKETRAAEEPKPMPAAPVRMEQLKFAEASSPMTSMAIDPEERMAVCGHVSGQISVWDLESQSIKHRFGAHGLPIMSIDWSPDGAFIVSAANDCTICQWRPDGQPIQKVHTADFHSGYPYSVRVTRDSKWILSGHSGRDVGICDNRHSSGYATPSRVATYTFIDATNDRLIDRPPLFPSLRHKGGSHSWISNWQSGTR